MELILDDSQTTSHEFSAASQFGFLLGGYQGGTWVAEMQTPDGEWVVLNDADYNRAGAWVAPGFPGRRSGSPAGRLARRYGARVSSSTYKALAPPQGSPGPIYAPAAQDGLLAQGLGHSVGFPTVGAKPRPSLRASGAASGRIRKSLKTND